MSWPEDGAGAGNSVRDERATSFSARAIAAAMSWTSRMSLGSSSWVTPGAPERPLAKGRGVSSRNPTRKAFRATLSPSAISLDELRDGSREESASEGENLNVTGW